jgi:ectoine hydroxylase-related dioxygenase (phytanoyl-CoA dioxygenase family)
VGKCAAFGEENKPMPTTPEQASPWLQGRTFASWREQFDRRGYLIFERVLAPERVAEIRAALAPYLARDLTGRNDFEGLKTNRVYALLAKSPHFAELAIHPLALAFAEAELGPSCLLSALLAINLQPGETAQPWHFDDGGVKLPRPRPAFGVSAFWAIDDTTELNGSTEIIPGSHLWDDARIEGAVKLADFGNTAPDADHDAGERPDAVKLAMPSGSLAITKGTLWHRGGANRSDRPRLIITPQYCAGWVRQLENMALAVPANVAETLPERARELIGYSIHPPFMGYVDGVHPRRLLRTH